MAHYTNQPISGFSGHIPGSKWLVGGRSSSMNALNQSASQSMNKVANSVNSAANSVARTGENMMNSVGSNYSNLENRGREFVNQMNPQQMDRGQSSVGSYNPNNGYPPQSANASGMSLERGVPMPYMNDSQISQFGFTSQGMPVRLSQQQLETCANCASRGLLPQGADFPVYQTQQPSPNAQQNPAPPDLSSVRNQRPADQQSRTGSTGHYTEDGMSSRPPRNPDHQSRMPTQQSRQPPETSQSKRRSQSVPRKVERDPFEGLEGGLYSKGEVQRNKERREMAMRGMRVQGGEWTAIDNGRNYGGGMSGGYYANGDLTASGARKNRNYLEDEEEDVIPAAGYSGHVPGIRRIGVGKNFNSAAKEAKKEYIRRRQGNTRESSEILQPVGTRNVQFEGNNMDAMQHSMNAMSMSGQPQQPYYDSYNQSMMGNSRSMNFPQQYPNNQNLPY